jgi:hypothetical protein
MPRKKAGPAEPKTPWIEIHQRPRKQVRSYMNCCICNRLVYTTYQDRLEMIPGVYLVHPLMRPEAQRKELGQLCENCLTCALSQTPEEYNNQLSSIMASIQHRLYIMATIRDHPRVFPTEESWVIDAAEDLAATRQTLTDLVTISITNQLRPAPHPNQGTSQLQ